MKMEVMKMDYRPMNEEERKYTFSQSSQISNQTGLIGYLRADFGKYGTDFYSTWEDFRRDLKTDDFMTELDDVINNLRDGDILSNRAYLAGYCERNPESSFEDSRNHYGVRLNTEKYSYLMRLCPNKGDYNLYCYCYVKEWLNRHMEHARRGIRFMGYAPDEFGRQRYTEKFRIADGDSIRLRYSNGQVAERVCRYIDDCHLEVGSNLYHVDEFMELCERNGHTVEPAEKGIDKKTKELKKNRTLER